MSLLRNSCCIILLFLFHSDVSGRNMVATDTIYVNLGADQIKCLGDTFIVQTNIFGKKYQWYYKETNLHSPYLLHSDTNNYIQTLLPGIYYVQITDTIANAFGTDTIQLKYLEPVSAGISSVPDFFTDSICGSVPVTFYLHTSETGNGPLFQWYKNGHPVSGANDTIYTDSLLKDLDIIYCKVTRTMCDNPTPAVNSNTIMVRFKMPSNAVVVGILGPVADTICNSVLHFSCDAMNITPDAEYKWYRNGILESTSSAYTASQAQNGDAIKVIVFSGEHCQQNDGYGADSVKLNNILMGLPGAGFNYQIIGDKLVKFINASQNDPPHIPLHYKWYFDDGDSSVEMNPVHQFKNDNIYHVRLIASNFCDNNEQIEAINLLNTGIKYDHKEKIIIYPNPSSDKVLIKWSSKIESKAIVRIKDLTGKEWRQWTITESQDFLEITTDDISPGIYLIELRSEEAVSFERLILKN